MEKSTTKYSNKILSVFLKIRDAFGSPGKKLKGMNLQEGFKILDYGAGLGSHAIPAAECVGETGKVYAADIDPVFLQKIKEMAINKGLGNIETILVDNKNTTGLKDNCVDVVFCFDMLGYLNRKNGEQDRLIEEFHRVMKSKSVLYIDSHRLTKANIISTVTGQNLFKFFKKLQRTMVFDRL